LTDQGFL